MNHVTLEVREEKMDSEVAWWGQVGFEEEAPYSDKYRARWIFREVDDCCKTRREQIHLFPRPDPIIPQYGHVAVVLGHDLYHVLFKLRKWQGLPEPVAGTWYWGTPRYMVTTPSGHRVELMESGPLPERSRGGS